MMAIIDYGMGNIRSVRKALEKVGAAVLVTNNPEEIDRAEAIVLPGVGAFKDCMSNLRQLNLIEVIKKNIQAGKPFLGICLGLHVLFTESEEFGLHPGMDVIKGKVRRFDFPNRPEMKIPHMGWNGVKAKKESSLLQGIKEEEYFYFVHSYYVNPEDKNVSALTTDYGGEFVSGIIRDNIFAVQFHPEKSQQAGLQILKNFKEWAKC